MRTSHWMVAAIALAATLSTVSAAIVKAEYFFNSDPGPGQGTPVSVATPSAVVGLTIDIPAAVIAALLPGTHSLTCRVRNDAGNWSIAFSRPFHIENPEVPVPVPLVAAEYYVDTDPGQGKGTEVSLTAALSQSFVVDIPAPVIAALAAGTHSLTCRVLDQTGEWSIAFSRPFHRENLVAGATALVAAIEYQWFKEGAMAAGPVVLPVATPARQIALRLEASLAGLVIGGRYQLRATPIDTLGQRGLAAVQAVLISEPQPFHLGSLQHQPDGTIRWTISGERGRSYMIQASTNLVHWIDLQPVTLESDRFDLTDADTAFPHRFYRLRTP